MSMSRHPFHGPGGPSVRALLLVACGAASSASAAAPLSPAQQFQVRGQGYATVSSSHCCGDTRFTGRFEASYELGAAGQVRLASLRLGLDDTDVVVSDGFLGLFSTRIHVRCAGASNPAPATGVLADPAHLKFAPGTLALSGLASEARLPDGSCADASLTFTSTNDVETTLLHDPAADRFGLDGTFHTVVEGESSTLTLHLEGTFANQPPRAALALRRTGEPYPQGGCPAFWRWNGQLWELVAEANAPAGLKGDAHSFSSDPDGSWTQGDVFAESWFQTRGSGERGLIASGRDSGPLGFEFGPVHNLELLAVDHAGAASATSCAFRVIDTRPPTVTAPAPVTLACSTVGGATAATSAPLSSFLNGALAVDASDPAPLRLTPRVGTTDVTSTYLFPADAAARAVTFRYQDRWGNLGQANANVTVRDTLPPSASVSVSPAALPADMRFWWITAMLTASDNCGRPVTWRLLSIASNAPSFDAGDISGASIGSDDRGFYLFSRRVGPQRIYTITYEARDAAGNLAFVKAKVTVG